MSDPQSKVVEAASLAGAIQLAARCSVPDHWPESARLLLQDAARLADLHKEIVARLVRDSDTIAEGVLHAFHRERGRLDCFRTIGTSEN